jgi:predicted DNA-binding transcriptional regulator AlpA
VTEAAKKPEPRHSSFLRRAQVAHELGITRNTLLRITRTDARFPRFFELAPGIRVIERRDLERWIKLKKMLAANADAQT